MPIDAISSWTLEQHLVELGDRVGLASRNGTAAGIPDWALHMDKLTRFWNMAYQKFLMADPKWSFAREEVSLTLNSDGLGPFNIGGSAARYKLPAYFVGTPSTNWRYTDGAGTYDYAQNAQYQIVERKLQAGGDSTGTPRYAGHYAVAGDGIDEGPVCWAVLFWPTPDRAYTMTTTTRTTKHRLRSLGERTVAGADHDPTILAFALCEWAQADEAMAARLATWEKERLVMLQASIDLDEERRPRHLGNLPVALGGPQSDSTRSLNVLVNGSPVTSLNLQE